MTFKLRIPLIFCLLLNAITSYANQANDTSFLVLSPKQCTALKQGDTCYVDLKTSWKITNHKDVCLFANKQKIQCWQNQQQGQFNQQLTMHDDLIITLQTNNKHILHTRTIRYAWVHKKMNSKAMRWRMF